MIDFHAHILPGLDDGSRDIGMTEAMLREEARQGVTLVAATPHFYANQMSIGGFLERRAEALEKTERLRRETDAPLPALAAGAEVYYFQGMGRARELSRLCVSETRTILVELPFVQWNEDIYQDIAALIEEQKLNVVLAHVERYIGLQKNRRFWNRVLALPLTPQINAESFLKTGGFFHLNRTQRFCMDFLKTHPRLIVGSDCHNMTGRAPNLAAARTEIAAALGAEALTGLDTAARDALASERQPQSRKP